MSKNFAQEVTFDEEGRMSIPFDWYPHTLPKNMIADDQVYFDTSFSFSAFHSEKPNGLKLGFATGNYGRSNIIAGKNGVIAIGKFVVLEATNLICNASITIGDHCMFSWGSIITDSWIGPSLFPASARKKMLEKASQCANRYIDYPSPVPVVIEDNVWVGFDAVILPGVRLGKGCVVGCKTIINEDVPPYAVITGNPARVVKYLNPDDTEQAKQEALTQYLKI